MALTRLGQRWLLLGVLVMILVWPTTASDSAVPTIDAQDGRLVLTARDVHVTDDDGAAFSLVTDHQTLAEAIANISALQNEPAPNVGDALTSAQVQAAINTSLAPYATVDGLNDALAAYTPTTLLNATLEAALNASWTATQALVSEQLAGYATPANVDDAISAALDDFWTSTAPIVQASVASQLANYTPATELEVKFDLIQDQLAQLVNESTIETKITQALSEYGQSRHPVYLDAPVEACTAANAGQLALAATGHVVVCVGEAWTAVSSDEGLYPSCRAIKDALPHAPDGYYTVVRNEVSRRVYCDMTTEGGGWEWMATKVTSNFDALGAAQARQISLDADAAGEIPRDLPWTQVLFRFKSSQLANTYTVYNRGAQPALDTLLQGAQQSSEARDTGGFFRVVNGTRYPETGTALVQRLHYSTYLGISEWHNGSNLWLDLWHVKSAYDKSDWLFSDDPEALGSKCIAGYCYLTEPVWYMVREAPAAAVQSAWPRRHWSSCQQISNFAPTAVAADGLYAIEIENQIRTVSCDMTTAGGGWTVFATKKTPSFPAFSSFMSGLQLASAINDDSAGHIPAQAQVLEILFKFADSPDYVIYTRTQRDSNLDSFFRGTTLTVSGGANGNWHRVVSNVRSPTTGNVAASGAMLAAAGGLAEAESGDYRWVNMAVTTGTGTRAVSVDEASAANTKCIAGVCRKDGVILVAYRDQSGANIGEPVNNIWHSCSAVRLAERVTTSGIYPISPNGLTIQNAYCDMTLEGGGWTLFATKVTPSFLFTSGTNDLSSLNSPYGDMAGSIPDSSMYNEILFRFPGINDSFVVYRRTNLTDFDSFLYGEDFNRYVYNDGFYRFSQGTRYPASVNELETVVHLHLYRANGISEEHSGTDRWIDLWSGRDGSNNYISTDSDAALGTKCIAGICLEHEPVWMMYRTRLDARKVLQADQWPTFPSYGSCLDILQETDTRADGIYMISRQGVGMMAYCDMTTEGGGWTLFATKVTPSFKPITSGQFPAEPVETRSDMSGSIPRGTAFRQALFKFATVPDVYTVYSRRESDSTGFSNFLMGLYTTDASATVSDFHTVRYGTRIPRAGPAAATSAISLHFGEYGIAEEFATTSGSILALWSTVDTTMSYTFWDDTTASGRKCLASICLSTEPILYMYR